MNVSVSLQRRHGWVSGFPRGKYTREIVHRTRPDQDALFPARGARLIVLPLPYLLLLRHPLYAALAAQR